LRKPRQQEDLTTLLYPTSLPANGFGPARPAQVWQEGWLVARRFVKHSVKGRADRALDAISNFYSYAGRITIRSVGFLTLQTTMDGKDSADQLREGDTKWR
jgi:hypothetical protein